MDMQLHRHKISHFTRKRTRQSCIFNSSTEFEEKDIVWNLNTCIYGLSDASRNWYLRVKEELDKLGVKCSCFEQTLFFLAFKNELQGLLITHVDDFCWGGTKYFKQIVIEPLQKVFSVGTENGKIFKYLRLDIIQNKKI